MSSSTGLILESSSIESPLLPEGGRTVVGLNEVETKVDHQNEFPLDLLHFQDEGENDLTKTGGHNIKTSYLVVNLRNETILSSLR